MPVDTLVQMPAAGSDSGPDVHCQGRSSLVSDFKQEKVREIDSWELANKDQSGPVLERAAFEYPE